MGSMDQFPLFNAEAVTLSNVRPDDPDLVFAFTTTNSADEATGYVLGTAMERQPGRFEVWTPGMQTARRFQAKLMEAARLGSSSQNLTQAIISRRVLKFNADWDALFVAAQADPSGEWPNALYMSFVEAVAESGSVVFSSRGSDPDAEKVLLRLLDATVDQRMETLPTATRWVVDHYVTTNLGGGRSQRDGRAEELLLALDSTPGVTPAYDGSDQTDREGNHAP